MKTSFRKLLSLVSSIVLISVTLPTYGLFAFATNDTDIYTDDQGNTSRIYAVGDGTYGLELYLDKAYNALPDTGYYKGTGAMGQNVYTDENNPANSNILEVRIRKLLINAVTKYNDYYNPEVTLKVSQLGTAAVREDINYNITKLTVSANSNIYVSMSLLNRVLPSDGFIKLKEINLSGIRLYNFNEVVGITGTNGYSHALGNMNFNLTGGVLKYVNDAGTVVSYETSFGCIYPELTTLILPSTLTKIEHQAMRNLPKLTQIVIPDTVTKIGRWNFNKDTNLKSITLPAGLEIINTDSPGYNNLVEPNQIKDVTWNYHGTNLNSSSHGYLVTSINNSKPVSLNFSNSCINFADLQGITTTTLTYLNIKNSAIESVEQGTTEYETLVTYLKGLQENNITVETNINLSTVTETYSDNELNTSKLTKLEDGTFSWDIHFEKSYHAYNDPDNYTNGALYGENVCTDMTRLGARVRNLLIGAANNYNYLNDEDVTVSTLGNPANYGDINYQITELKVTANNQKYISMGLLNRILPSDGFVNLKKIDISGMNIVNSFDAANRTGADTVCNVLGNMNFSLFGGIMYYRNANNEQVAYSSSFGCIYPQLTTLVLPGSLTKIENQALRNLPNLTEIVVPDTVTSIGRFNFNQDTALKTITLPTSLVSIDSDVENYNFLVGADNITGVTWNYHGQILAETSHEYLVNSINNSAPQSLDFSNSCVTAEDLLTIKTATLQYLNIKGSAAESVEQNQALITLIRSLRSKGVVVETNLIIYALGDVNQDNAVTIKDLVRLKKNLAALSEDLINDMNEDGVFNAEDLIKLKTILLTA